MTTNIAKRLECAGLPALSAAAATEARARRLYEDDCIRAARTLPEFQHPPEWANLPPHVQHFYCDAVTKIRPPSLGATARQARN